MEWVLVLVVSWLNVEREDIVEEKDEDIFYIFSDRIFVCYCDKMVKVVIEDILFVKVDGNYCLIMIKEKEYIFSVFLKILEESFFIIYFMCIYCFYVVNFIKIEVLIDN